VKRGKIPVSPTTRLEHPPTVERQRAAWWSAEQLRAFLHHVESDRLYAAWLLFAPTGMRRGEVAGLTWDDIDLDAGRVTVHWQLGLVGSKPTFKPSPKSDAGRRRMSLDPYTLAALPEYRDASSKSDLRQEARGRTRRPTTTARREPARSSSGRTGP
jgi:integrase